MNNHTKEEQEQIEYGLLYTSMDGKPFLLQLLIDNYCEHNQLIDCSDCNTLRCAYCNKARKDE